MSKSRREFLTQTTLTLLASAAPALTQTPATPSTPGAPPAFGTSPAVGPEVATTTFAEAEKLVQFPLTEKDRAQAAGNWRSAMAPLYERRTGPRKVPIPYSVAPYSTVNSVLSGQYAGPSQNRFVPSTDVVPSMPSTEEAIALSPIHHLSHWIQTRQLKSTHLVHIYLERIESFNPKINCIITLTRDHALA